MRLEIASDSRKGNILCSCQIQCSATDFHQLLSLHPPRVCAGAHPHIPPPEKVISRQPDLCQIGDNDCSSAPLQAFASPLLHLPVWIPFHKPFPTPYSVFWNDNLFFPLWAEVAPGAWRRNWRAALPLYTGCCSQFNLIKILPVVEFILLRSCLETRWQRFATAWSSVNLFSFCFCMYLFLIESSCFRVHEVPFSHVLQAAKRNAKYWKNMRGERERLEEGGPGLCAHSQAWHCTAESCWEAPVKPQSSPCSTLQGSNEVKSKPAL